MSYKKGDWENNITVAFKDGVKRELKLHAIDFGYPTLSKFIRHAIDEQIKRDRKHRGLK